MKELAPLTIHTKALFVVLQTQLSLEIGWHVSLPLELDFTVSVRARITKFTFAIDFKVPTELSLLFDLISILELLSLLDVGEALLLRSSGGFAIGFIPWVVLVIGYECWSESLEIAYFEQCLTLILL